MTDDARVAGSQQRSLRLVHSIFGGLMGRLVTLAAPFLVMPIMLRYLGDVHFGIWMTAVALTGMAQFSDLGIGNGLLTRLSSAFGREDDAAARRDIASAYATLTAVALSLAAIMGVALFFIAERQAPIHDIPIEPASLAIVAAAFGAFLAGIPAGVIQRVMYARQQVLLSNIWQIAGAALSVGSCWAAVALKFSPAGVVLAYSLPPVFVMLVSALWYFARNPQLLPGIADIGIEPARALMNLGMRFLALSLITSLALNADNIIIAANAGAKSVTEYAIPAKIGSLLGLIITTVFTPLWTANGEALARGDLDWVRNSMRRMAWIGTASVGAAGIVLTLTGSWIIHLWVGRAFADQQPILAFLSGLSMVMAATAPSNMVLNASGRIRVQIVAWTTFAITTISLKILFVAPDRLWVIPMISLLMYAMCITPAMSTAARRILRSHDVRS